MKFILTSILLTLVALCNSYGQTDSSFIDTYRKMALNYNHDLRSAKKNIAACIEIEKSARADLKPKLTGVANFQYTGNPMELSFQLPNAESPFEFQGRNINYGGQLTISQPIYTGGQLLAAINIAEQKQMIASEQVKLIQSSVCYQTDVQYWNTVARFELLNIAQEYKQTIEQLAKTIGERVEAGMANPQDLLMTEVRLNSAEFQLSQAKTTFETGRMALNSIIGINLMEPTLIEDSLPASISTKEINQWIDNPIRPEIEIAREEVKLAQSNLKLNQSRFMPKMSVGVDGSYSSPGYNFKKDLDPNYAIYAKLSVPIFEWGKRRNEKRASKYKIGMANDQLHKVEDGVHLEIQTAYTSLLESIKQIELTENSLLKAYENESQALERYYEGKNSIVELIDAQTYRQAAQINFVQAKASAQINYATLLKATNEYNNMAIN